MSDNPTTRAAQAIASAAKAWARYQEEWDDLATADTSVEAVDGAEAEFVTKVALAFDAVREVLIRVPPPLDEATLRAVVGFLEKDAKEGYCGEDVDGDYLAAQRIKQQFLGEEPTT